MLQTPTRLNRALGAIFLILCIPSLAALALAFLLTDCAALSSALVCAALLAAVLLYLKFVSPSLARLSPRALCLMYYAALAVWLAASLIYASRNLPVPRGDFEAIHTGVKEAVENGRLSASNAYFLRYSHQRGTLFELSLYFYILQRLGICATVNVLAGAALVRVGMALACALAFDSARRVWGAPRALAAGALALASPSLFTASAYYSISLGAPLAALAVWLYVLARRCEGGHVKKAVLYALCGGALAVGSTVSGTVNVLVAAIVIHLLITSRFREFIGRFAALALGFALLLFSFQAVIRTSGIIDFTDEDSELLPMSYWFMAALKGDGLYSEEDYQHIVSLPDYAARDAYASGEIRGLLEKSTPASLLARAWRKTRITWTAEGYSGADAGTRPYAEGYGAALSLLWLAGAISAARRRGPGMDTLWLLVCFGLFVFFCLWEAKPGAALTLLPELCAFGAFALSDPQPPEGVSDSPRR